MSSTVSRVLISCARALTWPMKPYRRANTLAQVSEGLVQQLSMPVPGGHIRFESRTARSLHDANSITHGEPETVAWIDALPQASVLWDIGANIGIYSLYTAFVRNIRVAAFEPSAASHAALARNIEINGLGELITPFCLALSDVSGVDYLYMANTGAGHSMHAFAQNTSAEGIIETRFKQSVIGYSLDDLLNAFDVPTPDYIKLDVDSIEAKIIAGARNTLTGHVKSILVEADQPAGRSEDSQIKKLLDGMGFQIRPGAADARNYIFDKIS